MGTVVIKRSSIVISMLAATSVSADTPIHRCLLEDGTFAFQEMPCPEPAAKADDVSEANMRRTESQENAVDDDVFDFVNPFDEPANASTPVETTLPEALSKDREECEKRTRNAIDAIDLELQEKTASKEPGRQHLEELLELTRQLRACKQL